VLGYSYPARQGPKTPSRALRELRASKAAALFSSLGLPQETLKVQLFLDVLLPWPLVATISTVWLPEESMPGW
jgi:hypothetical protein